MLPMKKDIQSGKEYLMRKALYLKEQKELRKRKLKNNEEELVYLEAITTIGEMVIEAKRKQDSDKLQIMAKAIQDIAFYVNDLQMERETLYLNQ